MAFPLKPGERLDELMTKGLQLIQSHDVFSFSMDAVLLARYVTVRPNERVLDLGTGNGIIPLLLTTRTRHPLKMITGLEIQPRVADMARRSIEGNRLHALVQIVEGDMKDAVALFGHGQFDVVTCNPPYLPKGQGETNFNEHVRIARHEVSCTLHDAVVTASVMVKTGGKVAFVHRPDRLAELLWEMRQSRLEPKRMRLVYPRAHQRPSMVLVEAIKNGKPDLKIDPPLIVYQSTGEWTAEMQSIYNDRSETDGETL